MKRKEDSTTVRLWAGPTSHEGMMEALPRDGVWSVFPDRVRGYHEAGKSQGWVGDPPYQQFDSWFVFYRVKPGDVVGRCSYATGHWDMTRYLGNGKFHRWTVDPQGMIRN